MTKKLNRYPDDTPRFADDHPCEVLRGLRLLPRTKVRRTLADRVVYLQSMVARRVATGDPVSYLIAEISAIVQVMEVYDLFYPKAPRADVPA